MKQNIKCFLITIFLIAIYSINLHASDLKWDASTEDLSGYKIYYGLSQGSYPFSEDVGNVTQYSLNNFSLSEGTTYYFVVRAYNATGESSDSNVITYAVPSAGDTTPPLAPAGVSGEILNGDILLTWEANSEIDISVYRVYYGTSTRNYGLPIPVDGTEYSISGLDTDEIYYLAVTAVDSSGNESGYSSPEIIKTVSIINDIEGSMLKWGAAAGDVSGYKIFFGTSEGNYTEDVDVGEVTQYSLTNLPLTIGVTYYFVVRAYNTYGESLNSNVVTYAIGELADIAAPVVTITSPTTETTYGTKSTSLNIGGTASDAIGVTQVSWTNSRGGSGTATGTTSWNVTGVALVEGENVLTVTALDEAGNVSTDVLSVVYAAPDTTAPLVTITAPTVNTVFNTFQASINISGTASDDIGVAQIEWWSSAGSGGTANGISNWDIDTIYLIEGENVITITAKDEAGNESIDTLTVVYTIPDTTAPMVTFTAPTTGTSYATQIASLNIGGTSSDAIGVTQVAWTNSRGGSGTATGTTSWSVAGIALAVGENIITVNVSDEAGNASTDTLTVVYTIPDTTAPVVTFTAPTTGTTYATQSASLNIGGTASDAIGVTQVAWTNSRGGSGTATGTISWSAAGLTLAEGNNVITVTARDAAGNSSTDVLTAVYTIPDTTAPSISINSPTDTPSFDTSSLSINISGSASDNEGVTEIVWSNSTGGSGTATGTDSWSISDIELVDGDNVITITARDSAGNESIDEIIVKNTLGDLRSKLFGAVSSADFPQTCEDTYLNAGAADTNTSSNSVSLNTYTWPTDTAANRIVMNWDVSVLPQNAVVLKAKLSMYMYGYDGLGGDEGYEITAHKIINNTPVVSNCTWNTYDGTNSWTGGSNGGEQDLAPAEVSIIVDKNVGYKEFDITEMVKNWIADPSSNLGLMLNSDSIASSSSNRYFRPTEYSDPDMRPMLIIEYYGSDVAPADTTAPVVTITSPTTETSYGTESASLNIGGTASDAIGVTQVAWTNSRGGSGTATGTTSWSAAGLTLAEGDNVITVTVRDEAGNTSTDVLTAVYTIPDTTAPAVTITAPTINTSYATTSASLNIGGTASDAIGVTQVSWTNSRGGSGTATGTTSWSAAGLTLAEGDNVITVAASDEAGNASTAILTVVYTIPDTTAPVVTFTAPTTGTSYATQSASLNIGGTSSDAIGVTQVSWTNSRGGSGTATGTTSWSVAGIALAEGNNVITVAASDEAGNASTAILTVVYTIPDTTAPVVTFTAPTTGTSYATQSASLNIGGTSSDAIGVTQVSWTNSRGGSGTATGTTSWSAAGIALAEGNNVITVTVSDEAENTSTDVLTAVYTIPDTTAPAVTITAPTTSTSYATTSASLNIGGTSSDAIGVTQVAWTNSRGGSGTATGTTSWSVAGIALAEGNNVITVMARDAAGNSSTDVLTAVYTIPVVVDTQAPVLRVNKPTTGGFYFTRQANVTISGTSSDNTGVKEIRWSISQGGSGVASGTSSWEAVSVPLAKYWNNITITAEDKAGNKTAHNFTVFSWR
jgi:hypothetical protein